MTADVIDPIAQHCRDLRKANGWSLQEAADRIGITKSHLWEFERGNEVNPTLKTMLGLARCYGLSPTDFMNRHKPHVAAETMAAHVAVEDAVKAAYRRGYADGRQAKKEPAQ